MDGKEIQNIIDAIREQAKLKNKDKCYDLLNNLIDEIKENDQLSYLKKEELVNFVNRAFLLFRDYRADEVFFNTLLKKENSKEERNNRFISTILNLLGELYYYIGDFVLAEKKYNESLDLRLVEYGSEHPQTVECKSNLALLLTENGNFRRSENMYLSIMKVYDKEHESCMSEYLNTLINFGYLYRKWGNYSKAIEKFLVVLDIVKDDKYAEIKDNVINSLGVLNLETANYKEAETLFEKSVEYCEKHYTKNHPTMITTKNNLLLSKYHLGYIKETGNILKEIIQDFPERLRRHPVLPNIINNLASIYITESVFDDAEKLIKELLDSEIYNIGEKERLNFKSNLAKIKLYQKKYEEFFSIINKLKMGQYELTGGRDIQYTKMFSLNAIALIQLKRYEEATAELQKAVDMQNEILFDVSTSFSRDYAWNFLSKIADDINIYLSFFAQKREETPFSTEQVYNAILKRKGIVFETNIERYRNILNEKNPVLKGQYEELVELKEEVILRTTKGYFHDAKEENEQKLKELNERISLIENRISAAIPTYRLEKEIKNVSLKMLQEKLDKETLFVDFFKFKRFDFEKPQNKFIGESYIIFYIDRDKIQYEIIEDAASLDEKIQQTDINGNSDNRGVSSNQDEMDFSNEQILSQIFELTFKGMESVNFTKYSQLCISTDGEFTKLPFEILLKNDGKYLIEDFEIYYVNSGRNIIKTANAGKEKQLKNSENDVTLFANPDFYIKSEKKDDSDMTPGSFRGPSTVFRNELDEFPPLPGTREEVEAINTLIDKNKIKSINMYFNKEVNDSEIKKIDSPLILHLATHGFYLDTRKDIHPFSRCGVALSGVNNMLRGENLDPWLEDGLLTATDSLSLKLMDTQLVILSACRTGVGEVRNGEGVLGLSSAFLCAGASSVILSLWNVPDFFTVELMTTFYEGIFAGYTKSRSLREAKLKMIRKLRSEWGEAPTWIWGGFILFGDNRPIFS